MDPWTNPSSTSTDIKPQPVFEDNFKPTINHTLPDSEQYLRSLENKLFQIKNDPNVLKQLQERREACMRSLLQGDYTYNQNENAELYDTPVTQSVLIRTIAPERQAQTSGETIKLIEYEILEELR